MADGRADGHFGEILQAVAGGPLINEHIGTGG